MFIVALKTSHGTTLVWSPGQAMMASEGLANMMQDQFIGILGGITCLLIAVGKIRSA